MIGDLWAESPRNPGDVPTQSEAPPSRHRIVDSRHGSWRQADTVTLAPGVQKKLFVCPVPECQQAFSRKYTLGIHMRLHEKLPEYSRWKNSPQVGLDGPTG